MSKDDISAKNKAGKQLRPGGKTWFSPKLLPWLRRRKAGVRESSIRRRKHPLRLRALREARALLGTVERGGNNRGPEVEAIIRANGGVVGEPWCGDFVAYAYRKAGSKAVTRAWAGTRFLGRIAALVSSGPRTGLPGDLVVFNFPGGHPDSDHVGLLVSYVYANGKKHPNPALALYIKTLDGNVGISADVSDSKRGGDGVGYRVRPLSQVNRVVRVNR